jgi:hypothetical protein
LFFGAIHRSSPTAATTDKQVKNRQTTYKKQPLSRREAFLERQRLVAERAAKKEAEKAAKAPRPPMRTPRPLERGGILIKPGFASEQEHERTRRAAFAANIVRSEASGPQWNGAGYIRWQAYAGVHSNRPYRRGDRISHAKFGSGTVITVDGYRLRIMFDDLAFGEKCIHHDFVVRQ